MMFYTKYESYGSCSYKQEDFLNCILKNNHNHLNNFGRGPPRDHSCEVWSKSKEGFQRRRCLSKNVDRPWTLDNGQLN